MSFFGFGLPELLLIAVLALIFIGPERLPGVVRQVMEFYNQVRALGAEWRDQVEREIGSDLRDLTRDVNQGVEAFGRSIEREVQAVEGEIREAQSAAQLSGATPVTTAMAVSDPPSPPENPLFPTIAAPAKAAGDDDDDGPHRPIDYRPSGG
jgi:sec-independent protein translocase protein TatB